MRFFFFGTLMDRDVLELVIARPAPAKPFVPARLPGYRRVKVRDETFPMILPAPGATLEGAIVEGLQPSDIERILFFESIDYEPVTVTVERIDGTPVEAHAFVGSIHADHRDEPWDFQVWQERDKPAALHETRLWMSLYGTLDCDEADRLWDEASASGRPLEDVVAEVLAPPQRRRAGG